MPPSTIFLSRLIGLFALFVAAAFLVQKGAMLATADLIVHDRPLLAVVGLLTLIGGLAMVLCHNRWSGGLLPVIVSLIGWATLIRGALLLILPPLAVASLFDTLHIGQLSYLFPAAILLVLGIYLTYGGFRRAPLPDADTEGQATRL